MHAQESIQLISTRRVWIKQENNTFSPGNQFAGNKELLTKKINLNLKGVL